MAKVYDRELSDDEIARIYIAHDYVPGSIGEAWFWMWVRQEKLKSAILSESGLMRLLWFILEHRWTIALMALILLVIVLLELVGML